MTLTRKQLEDLKNAITARRDALAAETREDVERAREESYGEVAGPVTDSADEAVADLLSDLGGAEVARDMSVLRELEAALARIDDGSYGRCASCGLEIEQARLRANPTATRCVACQRVHEKTYAVPGAPRL